VMVEDEFLALEEEFRHVMGSDGLGRPRQRRAGCACPLVQTQGPSPMNPPRRLGASLLVPSATGTAIIQAGEDVRYAKGLAT